MQKALMKHPDTEVVFFLGDGLRDLYSLTEKMSSCAVIPVRGNCDSQCDPLFAGVPEVDEITLLDKKIVLLHGHTAGAKSGVGGLVALAKKSGADIVLFGHTHTPCEKYISEYEKPFYLFNPGCMEEYPASFGILTLTEGKEPLFSHGEIY